MYQENIDYKDLKILFEDKSTIKLKIKFKKYLILTYFIAYLIK